MKKLKLLLVSLLLLLNIKLPAQIMSWDLATEYALSWNNDAGLLKDKYTITQVQGVDLKNGGRPDLYKWAKAKGWTDTEILQLGDVESAELDVMWKGQAGDYNGVPYHAWNVNYPEGKYPVTYPMILNSGQHEGKGSAAWVSTGVHGFGSTEFYIDHTNWITAKSKDKHIFKTASWGQAEGYQHNFLLSHFNLNGNRPTPWMDATYESSGVAAWDVGECSQIYDIYAHHFNNDGILLVRSTPAHVYDCSLFENSRSQISIIGGSGATVTCENISGDECPTSFYIRAGYNREGGCLLTVLGCKSETGLSWQFVPYKAQMLMDAEGWVVAKFVGVSLASATIYPDAMIRIKAMAGIQSSVEVSNLRIFGNRRTILHDVVNKKKWFFDKGGFSNTYSTFIWTSTANGQFWAPFGIPTTGNAPFEGRLGYLTADPNTGAPIGTWDDVNGLPCFDYTKDCTVSTPQCTWVLGTPGAWSTCTNNTQTRTTPYVSSVAGCVPTVAKPADLVETQNCVSCTWVLSTTFTLGPCAGGTQQKTTPYVSSVAGCVPTAAKPADKIEIIFCVSTPTSLIPVSSVLVLYDTDEAGSQQRANSYASTWGIPTSNIVGVSMGENHDLANDTKLTSVRNTILASGKQWCVLVWDTPSRAGSMSITSALTLGRITAYNSRSGVLPTSALYNYNGITPKTDKGLVPCFQLHSTVNFVKSSTAKNIKGQVYMLAANDGSGTPRGGSRVSQMQTLDPTVGYVYIDNRTGCPGECDANNLTGKTDVLSYFGSMYKLTKIETNTILAGAYGDYVTSTGGNLPDGLGQTPITYLTSAGFAGAGGTVIEPYQSGTGGSPGWLVEQFVNIQIFSSNYFGTTGKSLAQAVWSSVKCPGRYLMVGDPLCNPQNIPTAPITPPPSNGSLFNGSLNNTNASFTETVNWIGVKTIILTNINPTSLNYQMLCSNTSGKGIILLPNGSIVLNTSGSDVILAPVNSLVVGTPKTLTLTLPSIDFTQRGASVNNTTTPPTINGNAFLGTGNMEVKQ